MRALLFLVLFCAAANGQLAATDGPVESVCAAVAATPLPADMNGLPVPRTYPLCNSYSLYGNKDYAAARACAIQERVALLARVPGSPSVSPSVSPQAGSEDVEAKPAGGLIVLSELYANGEGVAQNPALAARFFCEAFDTGEVIPRPDIAGTQDILAMLHRLMTLTPSSPHVAYCNEEQPLNPLPGTPSTRQCEAAAEEAHAEMHAGGIEAGIDNAQQDADDADAAIKPVVARLSPVQQAAYRRVADAMQHLIDVQATGDILFPGAYGNPDGLYVNELHAAFENLVVGFAAKSPPMPTAADLSAADAQLNTVYRNLIAAVTPKLWVVGGNLTPESLRREQRAWLAYRDAFVVFGRTLAPELSPSAWLMPLTTARTNDLKQVYDTAEFAERERAAAAQSDMQRRGAEAAQNDAQVTEKRARVAQYFEHQTPEQAAAWQRVQDAMAAFVAAHDAAVINSSPVYADLELGRLYAELYAFQSNRQHGFSPADPVKAGAGLEANEQRLNDAYRSDLACTLLFKAVTGPGPVTGANERVYRSAEAFRVEERSWLRLREAWGDFLGTLFPDENRAARLNMFTADRAFHLQTLLSACGDGNQAPKEP